MGLYLVCVWECCAWCFPIENALKYFFSICLFLILYNSISRSLKTLKKHQFDVFSSEKHFEKQVGPQYQTHTWWSSRLFILGIKK
jgi:hypothetical protein